MKKNILLFILCLPFFASAQDVIIKLTLIANDDGGAYAFMKVTLLDTATHQSYSGETRITGEVEIPVPPNAVYELQIPNYTSKDYIDVPNLPGTTIESKLYYSRNMEAEDKAFQMSDAEKGAVDRFANALSDTTWFGGGNPFSKYPSTYYVHMKLNIIDFNEAPLTDEVVTIVGKKRHKVFMGATDANGNLEIELPKGDDYIVGFYYHPAYEFTEAKYKKGSSEIEWEISYIGTRELDRQKKEIEDKQASEALAKETAAYYDSRVAEVFERNKFKNPLVVCDASSGMEQITQELMEWFGKNAKANPSSQFVFFNDGDTKLPDEKIIGATGGIYYTPALPLDKLSVFMNAVIDKGNDADTGDNYIEALINGVKMAKQPCREVVLLADNHAKVSDMSLLPELNIPVHVVVFCSIRGGCDHNYCQPDFLKIAWKTKGSLHINNTDYPDIGKMKDGETIKIGGATFKLVNGDFFAI
jgi:hypothetical protein